MKDQILESYKSNKKTYHAFRERIINLLTDLLSVQEITIHQIGGRTKAIESLSKKIDDKGQNYNSIEDITDIVGIRIITYMESDVDAIANMVEKEFIKDSENSIDKRKLKADQFGYRSLHIVVSLNESRCELKEYKKYKGIKCEIQIRSILQHAWAEIEHDLGYKSEVSIPDQYKRTFNRLSALLESADIEFDRLKTDLVSYKNQISQLIEAEPELVDINKASLTSFVSTNLILLKAKTIIEKKTGLALSINDDLPDIIIKRIKYPGFKTIGDLEKALLESEKNYLSFVKEFVNGKINPGLGVIAIAPLMYFIHYWVIKMQDKAKFNEYFEVSEYSNLANDDFEIYTHFYKQSLL